MDHLSLKAFLECITDKFDMSNYIKAILLCVFFVALFPLKVFSQELLAPCDNPAEPRNHLVIEKIIDKYYSQDKGGDMSIYMNPIFDDPFSYLYLYYDKPEYELTAVIYNPKGDTWKEYRCQILRRPFNRETPVSVLYDLVASAVCSSSYCATETWEDGDTNIFSYSGFFASTIGHQGNCKELVDIIKDLVEFVKSGEKEKMYEMIPRMKTLTNVFKGYYPISTDNDRWHKSEPVLR